MARKRKTDKKGSGRNGFDPLDLLTPLQLKAKVKDLAGQLLELRQGQIITKTEQADIARLRHEHTKMCQDIGELAIWLRNNRAEEIARGEHKGKGLPVVLIGYLNEGDRAKRDLADLRRRIEQHRQRRKTGK